ncbi:hypothetical protein EZS27_003906 [termite gut metagenome]|uniref:VRR-NUC domain-containing protein n=1 Tax=termite gut metagenome TaxID=433724 RepID=A0A5J4STV4_9ZZZZ
MIQQTETDIQTEFFLKVRLVIKEIPAKLLYHIPNGEYRAERVGSKLKRMGVVCGVPDVVLALPNKSYHSLYIEFKSYKGKQSKEQIEFQMQAEKAGSKYVICRNAYDAIREIREYLKN